MVAHLDDDAHSALPTSCITQQLKCIAQPLLMVQQDRLVRRPAPHRAIVVPVNSRNFCVLFSSPAPLVFFPAAHKSPRRSLKQGLISIAHWHALGRIFGCLAAKLSQRFLVTAQGGQHIAPIIQYLCVGRINCERTFVILQGVFGSAQFLQRIAAIADGFDKIRLSCKRAIETCDDASSSRSFPKT